MPDAVGKLERGSRVVVKDTGPPSVPTAPIAMPLKVTTTGSPATTEPLPKVMTMFDNVLGPETAWAFPLILAAGVTLDAKKRTGYASVIRLKPILSSRPPAEGVKRNETITFVLLALRKTSGIKKLTTVTAPPIKSHDTAGLEAVGSVFVCTVTESLAALAGPIVQPTSVTATAVPAASGALPPTVNTMDRAPGCAGVSVAPAVDTLAVGVAEAAKKPDG